MQLLGPKYQPWLRAAVDWVEDPQINQWASGVPVGRPMRVVDSHNGVVHGSPPDAVAVFTTTETVVGAVRQVDVHGVASWIIFKVVEDQTAAVQHGLDPFL